MKRVVTNAAGDGTKGIPQMNHTRAIVATNIVLAAIIASGVAFAQEPASRPAKPPAPAASAPTSSKPSTTTEVQTWTRKQWGAAKKEWAKDKTKWANCRKQSSKQKLKGRKSWSFLYTCMKK